MIVFVVLFSAFFFSANKRQARGKKLIENTVSFLDIRKRFHTDASPGRLPVHILKEIGLLVPAGRNVGLF